MSRSLCQHSKFTNRNRVCHESRDADDSELIVVTRGTANMCNLFQDLVLATAATLQASDLKPEKKPGVFDTLPDDYSRSLLEKALAMTFFVDKKVKISTVTATPIEKVLRKEHPDAADSIIAQLPCLSSEELHALHKQHDRGDAKLDLPYVGGKKHSVSRKGIKLKKDNKSVEKTVYIHQGFKEAFVHLLEQGLLAAVIESEQWASGNPAGKVPEQRRSAPEAAIRKGLTGVTALGKKGMGLGKKGIRLLGKKMSSSKLLGTKKKADVEESAPPVDADQTQNQKVPDDRPTEPIITFCGHSLGGATATLLALVVATMNRVRMGEGGRPVKIRLVTFGQPEVGCEQLMGSANGLINAGLLEVHRMINFLDPIPRGLGVLWMARKYVVKPGLEAIGCDAASKRRMQYFHIGEPVRLDLDGFAQTLTLALRGLQALCECLAKMPEEHTSRWFVKEYGMSAFQHHRMDAYTAKLELRRATSMEQARNAAAIAGGIVAWGSWLIKSASTCGESGKVVGSLLGTTNTEDIVGLFMKAMQAEDAERARAKLWPAMLKRMFSCPLWRKLANDQKSIGQNMVGQYIYCIHKGGDSVQHGKIWKLLDCADGAYALVQKADGIYECIRVANMAFSIVPQKYMATAQKAVSTARTISTVYSRVRYARLFIVAGAPSGVTGAAATSSGLCALGGTMIGGVAIVSAAPALLVTETLAQLLPSRGSLNHKAKLRAGGLLGGGGFLALKVSALKAASTTGIVAVTGNPCWGGAAINSYLASSASAATQAGMIGGVQTIAIGTVGTAAVGVGVIWKADQMHTQHRRRAEHKQIIELCVDSGLNWDQLRPMREEMKKRSSLSQLGQGVLRKTGLRKEANAAVTAEERDEAIGDDSALPTADHTAGSAV